MTDPSSDADPDQHAGPRSAPHLPAHSALVFSSVDLDRSRGSRDNLGVLFGIDWVVGPAQRWVVLGPNGSGKTTLFQLASGYLHPTRGTVDIVGQRLGRVDVRRLRERIGLVSASVAKMVVPTISALDVVVSARHGALEPWWHTYRGDEWELGRRLLDEAGFGDIADRPFGVLSEGERQQVLLARSLMNDPELLLLDEPAAGLDIAGRERLVGRLGRLAQDPLAPPTVLITHHVEEIPVGFTHILLLREGRIIAAGPMEDQLTAANLSDTFGLALAVDAVAGRWTCRAV